MLHLLCTALALSAGPSRPPSDVQDLVYLSPSGPVLIRLQLRIDGKPFRSRFDAFISDIFQALDTNRDGVLSAAEAARVDLLGGPTINIGGNVITLPPKAAPKTGITRAGLEAQFAARGVVPFRLGGGGGYYAVNSGGRTAPVITRQLFSRLDTNKDGKLDAKELAAAEKRLLTLDADEDELIDVDELMDTPAPPGAGDGVQAIAFTTLSDSRTPDEFVAITGPDSIKALAQMMLKRKIPAGRFGKIVAAALAAATPDAEISLDIRGDRPPARGIVAKVGHGRKGVKVSIGEGNVVVSVGATEITLGPRQAGGGVFFTGFSPDPEATYKQQFKAADKDNNGYLDRKEAAGTTFAGDFAAMDADGDGMLFEREVLAWLNKGKELRAMIRNAPLSLTVSESGQGLFDLLDLNGDGVLSVREMRRAPEVLKRLGVKALSPGDVPRRFSAGLGTGGHDSYGFATAFIVDGAVGRGPRPEAKKGPEWFRKMDRNGDGDISRSEWLGTKEEFDRIDTDKDGLLSPEEAEAHDKLGRRK